MANIGKSKIYSLFYEPGDSKKTTARFYGGHEKKNQPSPGSIELDDLTFASDSERSKEDEIRRWKISVIDVIKKTPKKDCKKLRFEYFDFPYTIDAVKLYAELQKKISQLIPIEYQRPTIILHIDQQSHEHDTKNKQHITLIGGTGPLSDAHILEKVIAGTHKNANAPSINLISAPPPRPRLAQFSKIFGHLAQSVHYIKNFLQLPKENSQCFLLSNTAHMHITKMKKLIGHPIINVVDQIAKKAVGKNPKKILILGTSAAAKTRLYPNYLRKHGLKKNQIIIPAKEKQNELQNCIDKVKHGENINSYGESFLTLMFELIEKHQPSVVILACTEIPYFGNLLNNQGALYIDRLKQKLQRAGISLPEFIDSEQEIADSIIETVNLSNVQISSSPKRQFTIH